MIHFVTDYNTENFIEVFPFLSDEIPPEAKVKCQNKVEWLCLRLMRNGEWVEEAKEQKTSFQAEFSRVELEMWTLESCSICPMKVKMTEKSTGDRLIKVNRMSDRADRKC